MRTDFITQNRNLSDSINQSTPDNNSNSWNAWNIFVQGMKGMAAFMASYFFVDALSSWGDHVVVNVEDNFAVANSVRIINPAQRHLLQVVSNVTVANPIPDQYGRALNSGGHINRGFTMQVG